jgi:hypothetical protein
LIVHFLCARCNVKTLSNINRDRSHSVRRLSSAYFSRCRIIYRRLRYLDINSK